MQTERFSVFGAAPDTGNLGVSALCFGTLAALYRRLPRAKATVFDNGRGRREGSLRVGGKTHAFELLGAWHSRRYHREETLRRMLLSARLGGLGNAGVAAVRGGVAFDVSGGDSFTDLYGPHRWGTVSLTKRLALALRAPLVLLPQTYGPFASPAVRAEAAGLVRDAAMCWARDERSFEELRSLLGASFDPSRHRCGVDVAFGLEPEPVANLPERVRRWLEDPGEADGPLIGFNVSGLIHNSPDEGRAQYGLKASYCEVVRALVERFAGRGARVVLMPHVVTPPGHFESDLDAAEAVRRAMPSGLAERVAVAPALERPGEAKWVISRFGWFCGTRMHSTIAGLSSGVPTAAIAYSGKTLGVFETCGQGQHVADPRALSTAEVIEAVAGSWDARHQARASLAARLPAVVGAAGDQMDAILRHVGALEPEAATRRAPA